MDEVDRRDLVGARQCVVHQGAGQELARLVVDDFLEERAAEALRGAAVDLALDDHRVDRPAAVVDDRELEDGERAGVEVHFDDGRLGAERPCHRVGIEEGARAETWPAGGGEGAAADGGARDRAERDAAVRRAADGHVALGHHHVLRRALEQLGCDEPRLVRDLSRSPGHRGPRDRGHTACDRAHPEPDAVGVAATDDDVLDRQPELIGADLGQRGLVRLALGADADVHVHDACGIHRDVGAFERAEARALHVCAHADPDGACGRPAATRGLLAAPARVVEPREQRVERGDVVRRIVDDAGAVAIRQAGGERHLLAPDQIPAPQLGRIQRERARGAIEEPVEDERRLRPPGAAVRRREALVGDEVPPAGAIVRDPVRPDEMVDGVLGYRAAERRVGAVVPRERGLERDDRPIPAHAHPCLVDLIPIGRRGQEVLAPRLDPLHRAPEPLRHRGHQDVFRVDVALDAEAAADVGRDHAHHLLGEAEGGGHRAADAERHLGRGPNGQPTALPIRCRNHAARLDGHPGHARIDEPRGDDGVGGGEPGGHISDRALVDPREIVAPAIVNNGRGPRRRDGDR